MPLKRKLQYSHIQQPAPCSVLCPYFTRMHRLDLWGLYQQPDENYIHTRAIPAYTVYIMQQMSIGAMVSKFDSIS